MQNLLQRTRRLNKIAQRSGSELVDLSELTDVVQEITDADVLLINRNGDVLAKTAGVDLSGDIPQDVIDAVLNVEGTVANPDNSVVNSLFQGQSTCIIPVVGGSQRLGTMVMARKSKFAEEDLVVAEFSATILGISLLHHKSSAEEEENRNRAIVKMALDTLSYSEQEAVEHIFKELNGREGLLVASKIADRVGITRSVIVNALRKFESAGVIESRSLGMKGTFIRVLNDQLLPELTKLMNR